MGQNPCKQDKQEGAEGKRTRKWKGSGSSYHREGRLHSECRCLREDKALEFPKILQRAAAPPTSWLHLGEVGFDLLTSRTRKGHRVALSHRVCDNLSQQEQEADTPGICVKAGGQSTKQFNPAPSTFLHSMSGLQSSENKSEKLSVLCPLHSNPGQSFGQGASPLQSHDGLTEITVAAAISDPLG